MAKKTVASLTEGEKKGVKVPPKAQQEKKGRFLPRCRRCQSQKRQWEHIGCINVQSNLHLYQCGGCGRVILTKGEMALVNDPLGEMV